MLVGLKRRPGRTRRWRSSRRVPSSRCGRCRRADCRRRRAGGRRSRPRRRSTCRPPTPPGTGRRWGCRRGRRPAASKLASPAGPWAETCTCVPRGSASGGGCGQGERRGRHGDSEQGAQPPAAPPRGPGTGHRVTPLRGALRNAIRAHPAGVNRPGPVPVSPLGGSGARRRVLLGSGEPAEQLDQLVQLGGGEALGEDRRQRLEVRLGGAAQQRPAGVGDRGVGHAGVARAVLLAHEPRTLEAVEQARHPGGREPDGGRQVDAPHAPALGRREAPQGLEVGDRDRARRLQVGVERARHRGVRAHQADPGRDGGSNLWTQYLTSQLMLASLVA